MDDCAFELLELEAILALDFLLRYLKYLSKVILQHFNVLAFFPDYSLQAVLASAQTLLKLVHLVLKVVPFLSNFI